MDSTFDQCAICLTDQQNPPIYKKRRFHFEIAWTKYEKCKEVIQDMWTNFSSILIRGVEINGLQKEINELLDEEETRWHQRSRV